MVCLVIQSARDNFFLFHIKKYIIAFIRVKTGSKRKGAVILYILDTDNGNQNKVSIKHVLQMKMNCSLLSGCPAVFPSTDASLKRHSCHQIPLIFQQLTARQSYPFEDDNYWFGNFILVWDFISERSTDFSEATLAEELSSLTAEEQKEARSYRHSASSEWLHAFRWMDEWSCHTDQV